MWKSPCTSPSPGWCRWGSACMDSQRHRTGPSMYRSTWPESEWALSWPDDIRLITRLEVPEYGRLTEERQIGHVFAFFKFRGIYWTNLVKKEGKSKKKWNLFRFKMLVLMPQKDNGLVSVITLNIAGRRIKLTQGFKSPTWIIPSMKPPLPSGIQTAFFGSYGLARSFLNIIGWTQTVNVESERLIDKARNYLLVALLTTR